MGRTAIVTGGLRGLGRAMALGLAREGHRVVAVGHLAEDVTTKLDTMNRAGNSPYGPSKAALEMATEIWAKEVAETGVTVNILNPGAGANTPGMAEEMREASREGRVAKLVEPDQMVPPLLWLVSDSASAVNGMRFDANLWDAAIDPARAAAAAGRPAGLVLHS